MLRISIPRPCHERWDTMTPVENGAYCKSCSTVVTDFSAMSDKELAAWFASPKENKSCGRFRASQLNRDLELVSPEILLMDIPAWKKYLAILLICFSGLLTGCSTTETKDTDFPLPEPSLRSKLATSKTASLIAGMVNNTAACSDNIKSGQHKATDEFGSDVIVMGDIKTGFDKFTFTQPDPSFIVDIFGHSKK